LLKGGNAGGDVFNQQVQLFEVIVAQVAESQRVVELAVAIPGNVAGVG
jgi:hypothetical protein